MSLGKLLSVSFNDLICQLGITIPITLGCCKIKLDYAFQCLSWYQIQKDKHLTIIVTIIVSSKIIFATINIITLWNLSSLRIGILSVLFTNITSSLHCWTSNLIFEGGFMWALNDTSQQSLIMRATLLSVGLLLLILWKPVVTSQPPLGPVDNPREFSHLEMKPVCNIIPGVLYHTSHNHCSLLFKT